MAVLFLSTLAAGAGNWYVRSSSVGSNNGTDWNNAWSASSISWSSVQPGDTVWFAGGSYSSLNVSKSGSSGNPIFLKRVLSSDSVPTAAAGWSSGFDALVNISGGVTLSGSYITLDGRVNWGIQTHFSGGGNGLQLSAGAHAGIQIYHLESAGPGQSDSGGDNKAFSIDGGAGNPAISSFLMQNCYGHDGVELIRANNIQNGVIDHCILNNSGSGNPSANHPDVIYFYPCSNLIMRYCVVSNSYSEAIFFDYGQSSGIWIYGNKFLQPSGLVGSSGNGVQMILTKAGYSFGDIHIYNNVFTGVQTPIQLSASSSSASEIYNNIFWCSGQSWSASGGGSVSADYNGYQSGKPGGESHSVQNSTSPFVNLSGGDLHLTAGSWPVNAGKALASDGYINTDPDGNTRGSDGAWDIGAYEYGTSVASTNPVIQISPGTINFGAVPAGSPVTNSFTVQNIGAGTLAGSASVPAPFWIVPGSGTYSLSGGQSQTVRVGYTNSGSSTDSKVVTFTGGGGATASVSGTFQTVLSGLSFPASAGAITAPFTENASGDVYQTVETGVSTGGTATYPFVISSAGSYVIVANVSAANTGANSLYVNIDGTPSDPTMIWDIPITTGYTNQVVSWRGSGTETNDQYAPQIFNLSAGTHQLVVVGREANVDLSQFTITPYASTAPPAPLGLRIVANP